MKLLINDVILFHVSIKLPINDIILFHVSVKLPVNDIILFHVSIKLPINYYSFKYRIQLRPVYFSSFLTVIGTSTSLSYNQSFIHEVLAFLPRTIFPVCVTRSWSCSLIS